MDFGALLHYAKKKNDAATKDEHGKYYSTKYAPPKKESKESKQLSSNIQKFLKKREAEESERKRQEREKLSNLLAMRDEKSKNKIRKMLKVTKSANKSVLEDAKDCDNTAVTLAGSDQPDGDDYGYVSTEANAFYQKYIEKVKDVHEDKGFAPSRPQSLRDLSGTKERVKAAITREREEAKSHTRQRLSSVPATSSTKTPRDASVARTYTSSKTLYNPEAERRQEEEEQQQKKPKVKRPAQPPPMDFQALLRLAEKKQHEPVAIAMPEKKKEPERLLSAREKREQEERQRWKEQRAQRERQREADAKCKDQRKDNTTTQSQTQSQPQRMEPNGRIPKLNKPPTGKAAAAPAAAPAPAASESKAKPTSDSLKRPAPTAPSGSSSAKISAATKSSSSSNNNHNNNGLHNSSKRPASVSNTKPTSVAASSSSSTSATKPAARLESRNPYAGINKTGATREFPPREASAKTRQFPPQDVQRRKLPPIDARGRGSTLGRKQPELGNKRRICDEDDSEYDSELDDFIDDGDCEEDISSHIRDIFGYDKRRYRDLDEDDDQMESSFAQVQREELISKKLGLQEDLEDMRMEALHKKNKMAKKRTKRIDDDD
ncbi:protein SPT2 homolog [Drosophila innubila]|uniref:protein SPT2 homolog n=1 Tax=Drosophila innubila TaxID=198719 RepID=UPI00148B482D|nr:protein SPT2 homolog [Drosophila innubila]